MALSVVRLVPRVRDEDQTPFAAPTSGTVYYMKMEAEDSGIEDLYLLWGTGAPSTNYAEARIGSIYINLSNGEIYTKTDATTWTNQT